MEYFLELFNYSLCGEFRPPTTLTQDTISVPSGEYLGTRHSTRSPLTTLGLRKWWFFDLSIRGELRLAKCSGSICMQILIVLFPLNSACIISEKASHWGRRLYSTELLWMNTKSVLPGALYALLPVSSRKATWSRNP